MASPRTGSLRQSVGRMPHKREADARAGEKAMHTREGRGSGAHAGNRVCILPWARPLAAAPIESGGKGGEWGREEGGSGT